MTSEAPRVRVWRPQTDPSNAHNAQKLASLNPESLVSGQGSIEPPATIRRLFSGVVHTAWDRVKEHVDADRALQHAMGLMIELAAHRYAMGQSESWSPGQPLKLLLVGYSGTRNTGADVRVEEMIRQFRHLFGDEHVDLSIITLGPELTRGYFRSVKQLHCPKLFPRFLSDAVRQQHGVIACEGSMFKSKFANALSTMMVGGIGLALAEHKFAIGYGGEAGQMDPSLRDMVARYCRDAFIITRNETSRDILSDLGVASQPGTDTAWTFDPAPDDVGANILRSAGWDGATPILTLCPINPFWWPVKPNVPRAALHYASGMYADSHYGSVYFHRHGADVEDNQERYIRAIANAVRRFRDKHRVFPVMIGSEQLDRKACEALRDALGDDALGKRAPVIVSDEYDMYEMVSVMRQATWMVSSRYHAIVTSMPAGVASAGITMDERIRNLMRDRGQPHLALGVDDPDLEQRLHDTLEILVRDTQDIRQGIDRCVYKNLERMGHMGMELVDHVRSHYPDFPFRREFGRHGDPWAHLPTLPPKVRALVERVRSSDGD